MPNRVVKYVAQKMGKTTSVNAIVQSLQSEGRSLSVKSVTSWRYQWCEDFAFCGISYCVEVFKK